MQSYHSERQRSTSHPSLSLDRHDRDKRSHTWLLQTIIDNCWSWRWRDASQCLSVVIARYSIMYTGKILFSFYCFIDKRVEEQRVRSKRVIFMEVQCRFLHRKSCTIFTFRKWLFVVSSQPDVGKEQVTKLIGNLISLVSYVGFHYVWRVVEASSYGIRVYLEKYTPMYTCLKSLKETPRYDTKVYLEKCQSRNGFLFISENAKVNGVYFDPKKNAHTGHTVHTEHYTHTTSPTYRRYGTGLQFYLP
jgi:hypothetical protein